MSKLMLALWTSTTILTVGAASAHADAERSSPPIQLAAAGGGAAGGTAAGGAAGGATGTAGAAGTAIPSARPAAPPQIRTPDQSMPPGNVITPPSSNSTAGQVTSPNTGNVTVDPATVNTAPSPVTVPADGLMPGSTDTTRRNAPDGNAGLPAGKVR
jgi:hypothetical protein